MARSEFEFLPSVEMMANNEEESMSRTSNY